MTDPDRQLIARYRGIYAPLDRATTHWVGCDEQHPRCALYAALDVLTRLLNERDQCAPYLKEGETLAECICRNRADVNTALGLLAQEKARMGKIKAIRNDADYDAALLRIDALMDAESGTPEGDELDVLTDLVEHYEGKHVPMEGQRHE